MSLVGIAYWDTDRITSKAISRASERRRQNSSPDNRFTLLAAYLHCIHPVGMSGPRDIMLNILTNLLCVMWSDMWTLTRHSRWHRHLGFVVWPNIPRREDMDESFYMQSGKPHFICVFRLYFGRAQYRYRIFLFVELHLHGFMHITHPRSNTLYSFPDCSQRVHNVYAS